MSHLFEERKITWSVTPRELRNLAAYMEERWTKTTLGQSTVVDVVGSKDFTLLIAMNQEEMEKVYGPAGRRA